MCCTWFAHDCAWATWAYVLEGVWTFWPRMFRSRTFRPRTLCPQMFWPHLFPGADVSAKSVNSALLSLIFPSHHPPCWVCALPYSSEACEQCSSFIHLSLPPPPPEFVPFLTAQKRMNSALLSFIFPSPPPPPLLSLCPSLQLRSAWTVLFFHSSFPPPPPPPHWVCALPYSSEARDQCSSFIHLCSVFSVLAFYDRCFTT